MIARTRMRRRQFEGVNNAGTYRANDKKVTVLKPYVRTLLNCRYLQFFIVIIIQRFFIRILD